MKYFGIILFIFCALQSFAQEDVLFTVEGEPVEVSEFKYIYEKTNQKKADYSENSVNEYLELYKKFKLKVQRAKDMKLDTIVSLQKELEGYRTQLANSYLIDKEVTEKLIKEVYERQKYDVDISHIMINCTEQATPADTLVAFEKIHTLYDKLIKGGDFDKTAVLQSEDGTAQQNQGRIGFLTALLPSGFYNMETAAYTQKVGEIGKPIRTKVGYHIIRVNEKRAARLEMEVAHILIRTSTTKPVQNSKTRIDSIYTALKQGADWDELTEKVSEDKVTSSKKGNLGFFGINRYEKAFEDAAFALQKDGDFTEPVKSTAGWHIIKRNRKKHQLAYDRAKPGLQKKIKRDLRYSLAQDAMLARIKDEANYKVEKTVLDKYAAALDKEFLSYKWKPAEKPSNIFLFKIGERNYKVGDFDSFLGSSSRKRQRLGRNGDIIKTCETLFEDYVEQECLAYEESQLENKFPEFKYLMREYSEGILLFEATKMEVWDKASQDSLGLANYFSKLSGKGKYMWKDRAEVTFYSVQEENAEMMDKIKKMAESKSTEEVLAKFNKPDETIIKIRREVYEKGKNDVLDAMPWKVGSISAIEKSKRDKSSNFMRVEKVIPPMEKSLKEARGYIVADYQDYLEKEWIQELQRIYKVEVNQKVLKKLIKK